MKVYIIYLHGPKPLFFTIETPDFSQKSVEKAIEFLKPEYIGVSNIVGSMMFSAFLQQEFFAVKADSLPFFLEMAILEKWASLRDLSALAFSGGWGIAVPGAKTNVVEVYAQPGAKHIEFFDSEMPVFYDESGVIVNECESMDCPFYADRTEKSRRIYGYKADAGLDTEKRAIATCEPVIWHGYTWGRITGQGESGSVYIRFPMPRAEKFERYGLIFPLGGKNE